MQRMLIAVPVLIACTAIATLAAARSAPALPAGPATGLSTIVVPIRTSLAPLLPLLESQVQKTVRKTDGFEMDRQNRFGVQYRVQRDPIVLNMQGGGIHATARVHYAIQGCRRTWNPLAHQSLMWPCLSCGFEEPMREANILLDSQLEWDQQWRLRSRTRARPVDFTRPCAVTFFKVNISHMAIAPVVDEQLREVVKTIDRNAPGLTNLRPAASQMWTTLQTPIEVAPRTWLVLEPVDVALAPIRGSGLIATTAIVLHANTRVVVGGKPAAGVRPLPPLLAAVGKETGLHIPIDFQVPYEEANRLLTQQFAHRLYDTGRGTLSVQSIRLSPIAGDRLSIEASIDYRGGLLQRYRGLVLLEGVPRFDAVTSTLSIADLNYSLDRSRKNPFLRLADRFAHESLRARLNEGARWSVAGEIATIRDGITRGMARSLAPGVRMSGSVTSIEPRAVVPEHDGLRLHVIATGTAEIALSLNAK